MGGQDTALLRFDAPLDLPRLPVAAAPSGRDMGVEIIGYFGYGMKSGFVSRIQTTAVVALTALESATTALGPNFYGLPAPCGPGLSGAPMLSGGVVYGVVSHIVSPSRGTFCAYADILTAPPVVGQPAAPSTPAKPVLVPAPFPALIPYGAPRKAAPAPACAPGGT
jgi:hypothetical protein